MQFSFSMRYRMFYILFFLILFSLGNISSQQQQMPSLVANSISSSPAFNLLGVNPELVIRPSDVKEFKVDWRVKNYKVAPDLALEMQPLWWLYYRNKGIAHFRKASKLERVLSTMSFSMATAKMDNINHLGYAFKFNLYKEKDPYLGNDVILHRQQEADDVVRAIDKSLDSLKYLLAEDNDEDEARRLENEVMDLKFYRSETHQASMDDVTRASQQFVNENWNMDMLDAAIGFVHKYDNASLDSVKMEYAGYAMWLNYAKGMGRNSLLTLMTKYNRIGGNGDLMLGSSFRYGTSRFNLFVELVFSRINNNRQNGFALEESFDYAYTEDLGRGWYAYEDGDGYSMYSFSYGGDFKLSRKILLNFALRTEYTSGFKFERLVPVANLVCLMN